MIHLRNALTKRNISLKLEKINNSKGIMIGDIIKNLSNENCENDFFYNVMSTYYFIYTVKNIHRKVLALGFPERNLKSVRNTEQK